MFNNPGIRIHRTGSLFPTGQEGSLFHSRMIRTPGGGRTWPEERPPKGYWSRVRPFIVLGVSKKSSMTRRADFRSRQRFTWVERKCPKKSHL